MEPDIIDDDGIKYYGCGKKASIKVTERGLKLLVLANGMGRNAQLYESCIECGKPFMGRGYYTGESSSPHKEKFCSPECLQKRHPSKRTRAQDLVRNGDEESGAGVAESPSEPAD